MDIVFSVHYSHNYWIILLPAILAASDVITGFAQAQITGTKRSSIMRKGFYRKCGELGTILLVWIVCVAVEIDIKVVAAVSIYVCIMESLSILENLKSAGVPIPDFITKKANEIADEINHGDMPHTM